MNDAFQVILAGALALNAALGLAYRVYRASRGGPIADVWGQIILGIFLAALAVAVGLGAAWARWPALVYGLVYGLVAMPVWVLGVLIPLPPRTLDFAFTVVYWAALAAIVVASIGL